VGESIACNGTMQPTPSPLRLMADPTAHHVLPSRRQAAPDANGAESRSSSSNEPHMPPPPPRPYGGHISKKRKVLAEDEFVGALESIIERDFFPVFVE